ncbi:hypothetical protein ACFVWN_00920 [Nocardiopsis flavescens]|uniref:hypothetical protein n=1 Tax=Nocardiopsis flavescens TaxID=758803 RepID=UPI00364F462B
MFPVVSKAYEMIRKGAMVPTMSSWVTFGRETIGRITNRFTDDASWEFLPKDGRAEQIMAEHIERVRAGRTDSEVLGGMVAAHLRRKAAGGLATVMVTAGLPLAGRGVYSPVSELLPGDRVRMLTHDEPGVLTVTVPVVAVDGGHLVRGVRESNVESGPVACEVFVEHDPLVPIVGA